jgi:phosphate:Na+ symporter
MGQGPVNKIAEGDVVNIARYIANGHTLFNVINGTIFLIFLPMLIKVAVFLSPKEDPLEDAYRMPNFSTKFDDTPIAALPKARSEIIRMAEVAANTLEDTILRIEDRDFKKLSKWQRIENFLDDMQLEITSYLSRLYQSDLSQAEAKEISNLMRMTNNIERIGDSVENIAQLTETVIENNIPFTGYAKADLKTISDQTVAFLDLVTDAIRRPIENLMVKADEMENTIDRMREEMRQGHISRLRSGECGIDPGLVFIDLLTNFEKIGDYCFNIAQAVTRIK